MVTPNEFISPEEAQSIIEQIKENLQDTKGKVMIVPAGFKVEVYEQSKP